MSNAGPSDLPQEHKQPSIRNRDRTHDAVWGACLGFTLGVSAIALPVANQLVMARWPDMPDTYLSVSAISYLAEEKLGIGIPLFWILPVVTTLLFSLLGALSTLVVDLLRLDRQGHARTAIWWAIRALSRPVALWSLWALAGSIAVFLYRAHPSDQWYWLLVVPIGWLTLITFGIYSRDVASSSDGSGWWLPRWPGLPALASILVLGTASEALSTGLDHLPVWLAVPLTLPYWIMNTAITLAVILALLDGLGLVQVWRARSQLLAWHPIGTFLLLQIRLWILASCLFAPAVPIYIFMWKTRPLLVAHLETAGEALPIVLAVFFRVALFIGHSWWIFFLLLGYPFINLVWSRYVALAFNPQEEGSSNLVHLRNDTPHRQCHDPIGA